MQTIFLVLMAFSSVELIFANQCAYFPFYPILDQIYYTICPYDCCIEYSQTAEKSCCYYNHDHHGGSTWWVVFLVIPAFICLVIFIVLLVCLYKKNKAKIEDKSSILSSDSSKNGINPYARRLEPLNGVSTSKKQNNVFVNEDNTNLDVPPTYISQFAKQPTIVNFQSDYVVPVLPAPHILPSLDSNRNTKELRSGYNTLPPIPPITPKQQE